jgi:hypothetical protein
MAWEHDIPGADLSFQTVTDLSAKQYCFVHLSADNTVALATDNSHAIGVLQNKPLGSASAPVTARVRVLGVSRVIALDTTCTYGVFVGPDTNGRAAAKTANKDIVGGIVLEGAATAGDPATVFLFGPMSISL